MTIRIPALCFGTEFQGVGRHQVVDLGTGEELASLCQVVGNRIAIDCGRRRLLRRGRDLLLAIPIRRRIEMCVAAAKIFLEDALKCGEESQTFDDYIEVVSRTSGLSLLLARNTAERIAAALRDTEAIITGLTGDLPLDIFDKGYGEVAGTPVRMVPRLEGLGCFMPNNSPGVHVVWLISVALGIPVLIRPGSAEPFTPYRIIQALIKAGFPAEAFGYYPCDHQDGYRIPFITKGSIVFGSDKVVSQWKHLPLMHAHGAGHSKVVIGKDRIEQWRDLVPEIAGNVSDNSGRSCYAASGIWVPRYGREIAMAVAEELAAMVPRPRDHAEATLSAMAMPNAAQGMDRTITAGLAEGGAEDISALFRDPKRLQVFEERTYMLPQIVLCDSPEHPLAGKEFLFPYAAVVESSTDDTFNNLPPTLSMALYTHDEALIRRARDSKVRLLNINARTSKMDRRQPHEEDLVRLLWERRAELHGAA